MEESRETCLQSEMDSSMNSGYIFKKTYALHMKFVKGTAVVLLTIPLIVLICVTIVISANTLNTNDNRYSNKTKPYVDLNSTLCTQIKQYPLTGGIYATICVYKNSCRLDIRYFISGRPTIKGIYIDRTQFLYLKRTLYHIEYEMNKLTWM